MASRMTPRKYAKLENIRWSVGSWCETEARARRAADFDAAVHRMPSEVGQIIRVVTRTEFQIISESENARGVKERLSSTKTIRDGEVDMLPGEGGAPFTARVAVVPTPPYGEKAEIVAAVQKIIKRREGVTMSLEWIETCWDEFRRFENEISAGN